MGEISADYGFKSFLVDLLLENDIVALDQFKLNDNVGQIPVQKAPGRPRKAVNEHSKGFSCKGKMRIDWNENFENSQTKFSLECSKIFNSKKLLKQHVRVHEKIKQYKCDQCDYATHYKHNLKAHKLGRIFSTV